MVRYREAEVLDVLHFISKIANVNFVYHQEDLQFKVTLVSEHPVAASELVSVVLQVLQAHGFSITEQQGHLIIHRSEDQLKLAPIVKDQMKWPSPIVTQVFNLHNIAPSKLADLVRPSLSKRAGVQVLSDSGHLVVTDLSTNVEKVADLIQAIDAPSPGIEIVQYAVQCGDPARIAATAREVMAPLIGETIFSIVAQPNARHLFVISSAPLIERTLGVLETLDTAQYSEEGFSDLEFLEDGVPDLGEAAVEFFLGDTHLLRYKLQYHSGDRVRESLIEVAKSISISGLDNSDLITAIQMSSWLPETNTLIFTGDSRGLRKVKRLLPQIDAPRKQVFIEALVLRTSVHDALEFGVDWGEKRVDLSSGGQVASTVGMASPNSPLPGLLNPLGTSSAELLPSMRRGLGIGIIGRFVSKNNLLYSSLGALINAIQTDHSAQVIINPKILTQDGHTARIFVGENVAFIESLIAEPGSQLTSQSIGYRDVGTTLKITPLLGTGDAITLQIEQEIEETRFPSPNQASSVPTSKSVTQTRVQVPDQHFLVLSGQISQSNRVERSGLPCLGGLPIVGAIFADCRDRVEKQNLIIFIRPHLVNTKDELKEVTKSERAQYDRAAQVRSRRIDWSTALKLLNLN
jgi:type II secretion system protein D